MSVVHEYVSPAMVLEAKAKSADSACVLVIRKSDGKVLSASRRGLPLDVGLPGGKLEPELDADALACAIREALEETGVKLRPEDMRLVYVGPTIAHTSACYIAYAYDDSDVGNKEEGISVAWVDYADLCSDSVRYHAYNRMLEPAYTEFMAAA